mmetsp:Transcript_5634/g.16619  ORF Transcript_5634/g.16619 Transcript_5634/m.16619 type:complete len:338 (+) Transcript_5634:146-1159(+)
MRGPRETNTTAGCLARASASSVVKPPSGPISTAGSASSGRRRRASPLAAVSNGQAYTPRSSLRSRATSSGATGATASKPTSSPSRVRALCTSRGHSSSNLSKVTSGCTTGTERRSHCSAAAHAAMKMRLLMPSSPPNVWSISVCSVSTGTSSDTPSSVAFSAKRANTLDLSGAKRSRGPVSTRCGRNCSATWAHTPLPPLAPLRELRLPLPPAMPRRNSADHSPLSPSKSTKAEPSRARNTVITCLACAGVNSTLAPEFSGPSTSKRGVRWSVTTTTAARLVAKVATTDTATVAAAATATMAADAAALDGRVILETRAIARLRPRKVRRFQRKQEGL